VFRVYKESTHFPIYCEKRGFQLAKVVTTVGSILVVIILLIRRKQEVAKTRIESEFKFFKKL